MNNENQNHGLPCLRLFILFILFILSYSGFCSSLFRSFSAMTIPVSFLGDAVFTVSVTALWFYNCAAWQKWQHLPKTFSEFIILQAMILLTASLMRLQFVILSLFTPFDLALLPCFGLFVWYAVQKSLFQSMFLYLNLFVPLILNLYIATIDLLKNMLVNRFPLSQQPQAIARANQLFREAARSAELSVDDDDDANDSDSQHDSDQKSASSSAHENPFHPLDATQFSEQLSAELNRFNEHTARLPAAEVAVFEPDNTVDTLVQKAVTQVTHAKQSLAQAVQASSACQEATAAAEEAIQSAKQAIEKQEMFESQEEPLNANDVNQLLAQVNRFNECVTQFVHAKQSPEASTAKPPVQCSVQDQDECDSLPDLIPNDDN